MAAITPQQMTDFLRTKSNCVDVIAKRKQDVATVMKERAAQLAASSSRSSIKCPPKLQDCSEEDEDAVALEQAIQESMTSKKHMTEQEELDAAIKASMNPKQHTTERSLQCDTWKSTFHADFQHLYSDITHQINGWQGCYQGLHQFRFDELKMQMEQSISHIARTEIPLGIRSTFAIIIRGSASEYLSIHGYIYLITNKTLYQLSMFVNDTLVQNGPTGKWYMLNLSTDTQFVAMPYGTYFEFVPIATLTDTKIHLLNKLRHLFGYVGKASNTFSSRYFEEDQQMLQANMDKIHETIMEMCD